MLCLLYYTYLTVLVTSYFEFLNFTYNIYDQHVKYDSMLFNKQLNSELELHTCQLQSQNVFVMHN